MNDKFIKFLFTGNYARRVSKIFLTYMVCISIICGGLYLFGVDLFNETFSIATGACALWSLALGIISINHSHPVNLDEK
jgi:hypothetical protein